MNCHDFICYVKVFCPRAFHICHARRDILPSSKEIKSIFFL